MQCLHSYFQICFKIHSRTEIASTQSLINIFLTIQSSDLEYQIHTPGSF